MAKTRDTAEKGKGKKSGRKKLSKKQKVLIISAAVVAAAAIGIIIYFLVNRNSPQKLTAENYKQIEDEMKQNVQDGYFETYMNTEWTFSNGKAVSKDALLGNSPSNKKPIRCEVHLADSSEILFETGVLPVGTQVDTIKLSKDLEAGTYPAVCTIYLLNEDDGEYTESSQADFNITLIVEN